MALCPANIQRRSSNGFFLLHEAAFGNAPLAVATILCAAFPHALYDRKPGQTPHEMKRYHHAKLGLQPRHYYHDWSTPEEMLQDAMDIRQQDGWLQSLASIQLTQTPDLSAKLLRADWDEDAASLGMPLTIRRHLFTFCTFCLEDSHETGLHSIPENCSITPQKSRIRSRRRWRPHTPMQPLDLEPVKIDNVAFTREEVAKNEGRHAGMHRSRNYRCDLARFIDVRDGQGKSHHLVLHAVRQLPKGLSNNKIDPKWPSKAPWRRERAKDRCSKMFEWRFHWHLM
jgi:hypothetical protein